MGKAVFDVPMQPWHDLYKTDITAMLFSPSIGFMATSCALCGLTGAWLGWNRGGDRLFSEVRHRTVPDDLMGRLKRIAADDAIMLGIAALNYSVGNWIVTVLFVAVSVCHAAFVLLHRKSVRIPSDSQVEIGTSTGM
jgi:hypothetical protein